MDLGIYRILTFDNIGFGGYWLSGMRRPSQQQLGFLFRISHILFRYTDPSLMRYNVWNSAFKVMFCSSIIGRPTWLLTDRVLFVLVFRIFTLLGGWKQPPVPEGLYSVWVSATAPSVAYTMIKSCHEGIMGKVRHFREDLKVRRFCQLTRT